MSQSLLIELGVEELPPKALNRLMHAFAQGITQGFKDAKLPFCQVTPLSSPRRLAVHIADVAENTPTEKLVKPGPTVAIAFDEQGQPTKAAEGFARGLGVTVDELVREDSKKGERLVYYGEQPGQSLETILPAIFAQTLKQLPIPKRMRWGRGDAAFIRPVHWLVALHGTQVLPLTAFDIQAGRTSYGHRVHAPQALEIAHADDYQQQLTAAYVMVDAQQRAATIRQQVVACADALGGEALLDEALLAEVSALVEWPVALSGRFDEQFLVLPREVLISTLQVHQRYFPVAPKGDASGQLLNAFITVANIKSQDPQQVVAGNQRVINPRLADAYFFWQQDQKTGLEAFSKQLAGINYQRQLGTMADKTQRFTAIGQQLLTDLAASKEQQAAFNTAAPLAKADLLTQMVDEFPELQGIIGQYYAKNSEYPTAVYQAIGEQYAPAQASAPIAQTLVGQVLSLADHLDTLAGIFTIGKRPSGSKDPFALRRAAYGVLRTLIEGGLTLDLKAALAFALQQQPVATDNETLADLWMFHVERLRGYYHDQGLAPELFASVAATSVTDVLDFDYRIKAVAEFTELAAAPTVCGAHKRARNILKKNGEQAGQTVQADALVDEHAKALHQALIEQEKTFTQAIADNAYTQALTSLAELAEPLDAFFEHVMVMDDNADRRANRLALLVLVDQRCRQVADLSELSNLVA